jgi:acyl-CoA dehydrogenase
VQFPIARAYMHTEAASLVRWQAATLFDHGQPCGAQANSAKLLASEAAWEAAEVAMTTYGGSGMAVETGIERKFREARLYLVAPITNNLVTAYVAEHVLGLPRSYGGTP